MIQSGLMELYRSDFPTVREELKEEGALRWMYVMRRGILRRAAKGGRIELIISQLTNHEPRIIIPTSPTSGGATFFARVVSQPPEPGNLDDTFKTEMTIADLEKFDTPTERLQLITERLPDFIAELQNLAYGAPIHLFLSLTDQRDQNPVATVRTADSGEFITSINQTRIR